LILGRKISKSDDLNYDYYENIQLVNTQPGLILFTLLMEVKGNKDNLIYYFHGYENQTIVLICGNMIACFPFFIK
jgi:hypothetical protein